MVKSTTPKVEAAEQWGGSGEGNALPTATRASGKPSVSGAPPSNTAPANYLDTLEAHTRVLRFGVDSLYLNYRGSLRQETDIRLVQLKELAQSDEPGNLVQAVIEAGNHCFEVLGRGRSRFPFVLVDNWLQLQVSRASTSHLPMCLAQVSSELLTRSGFKQSVVACNSAVACLGEIKPPVTVSRVDLCMDFETLVDLEELPQLAWVTRSHLYQQYWDQRKYSGCVFGQGGDLSCRIYNKTLEIKKSRKTYLYDHWREAGWEGEADVWRLEFQFRRTVLAELGVSTPEDLHRNQEGLWKYAMTRWLRLTEPTDDSNQTRWPDHPLWVKLRGDRWHRAPQEPLHRVSKSRFPSDERLFVHGLGPITSFMARENIQDIGEGFRAFEDQAHAYHRERSQKTNRQLSGYASEKVRLKSRKYNQLRDPENLAVRQDAYKKGKEGE